MGNLLDGLKRIGNKQSARDLLHLGEKHQRRAAPGSLKYALGAYLTGEAYLRMCGGEINAQILGFDRAAEHLAVKKVIYKEARELQENNKDPRRLLILAKSLWRNSGAKNLCGVWAACLAFSGCKQLGLPAEESNLWIKRAQEVWGELMANQNEAAKSFLKHPNTAREIQAIMRHFDFLGDACASFLQGSPRAPSPGLA